MEDKKYRTTGIDLYDGGAHCFIRYICEGSADVHYMRVPMDRSVEYFHLLNDMMEDDLKDWFDDHYVPYNSR